MVSANRQSHIVATLPKKSGYGNYRNITLLCAALPTLQRINTEVDSAVCEQEGRCSVL